MQVSSSGIKNIATGDVQAKDATLMKLCCDKVKPDKCCSSVLGDLLDSSQYGGEIRNYSLAERAGLCQAVDTCALKDYSAGDPGLGACTTAPWSYETVVAEEFDTDTLSCAVLGGNSTQMGKPVTAFLGGFFFFFGLALGLDCVL